MGHLVPGGAGILLFGEVCAIESFSIFGRVFRLLKSLGWLKKPHIGMAGVSKIIVIRLYLDIGPKAS